ncbi:hypothetical protein SEA_KEANU_86 [Streptomyces phage Keanu]|nr:hypothetical protein SEA_KEANU_86 [Streptomyces phage Keanu]
MNRKASAIIAGLTATAALGLVGCSGDDPAKASGLRDDVKHVKATKAVTKPATRTVVDYRNDCQTKFRTVTKSSGTGTSRRTWTEQEPYQDCTKVRVGTHQESYTKTVKAAKPAKWCVELDDVNGDKDADDQWFRVSSGVYADQAAKNEGAKVTDMEYQHKGC